MGLLKFVERRVYESNEHVNNINQMSALLITGYSLSLCKTNNLLNWRICYTAHLGFELFLEQNKQFEYSGIVFFYMYINTPVNSLKKIVCSEIDCPSHKSEAHYDLMTLFKLSSLPNPSVILSKMYHTPLYHVLNPLLNCN